MSQKAIAILKYVLSLALAAVLLYFAFRNIEFSEFLQRASQVDYTWVILSIGLSLIGYYARSYRWNILMKPLGYPGLNVNRTLLAVLVGYLANLAFPRLGEVTRCGMMKRSDDVPVAVSLGTVITERIVDLISLVILMVASLGLEYDRLLTFLVGTFSGVDPKGLLLRLIIGLIVGGLILFGVAYMIYKRNAKIRKFLKELIRGILSLREIDNLSGFLLSTLVLWLMYYFMSYTILFSIPDTANLSWSVGIMLLIVGGIALAMPVQGGIGTYHAFVGGMLILYGVEKTTGIFLATLLHTSQLVAVAVFGGVALVISLFVQKQKASEAEPGKDR